MASPRRFTIVVCFETPERDRFLMARHRQRGWELPGGRIEPGEAPLAAAQREFEEETRHGLVGGRVVLEQVRSNGTCWVVAGTWGSPVANAERPGEQIVEVRFVERLSDVSPLAFPDDPYAEIGAAISRPLERSLPASRRGNTGRAKDS